MNNKIIAFGILLALGLSMAQIPEENTYLFERYYKAHCLAEYYGENLAVYADKEFEAPGMAGLNEDMWDSLRYLASCGEDYSCFNAEYMNFISIVNEIVYTYFYYGILYYDVGELYHNYHEQMSSALICMTGGEPET